MSDKRAIGVFDSGLGGLTVVKELIKALPNESIVYACQRSSAGVISLTSVPQQLV